MTDAIPPTVIIVHPKERRSKCSVEPLRGREGYLFRTWRDEVGANDPGLPVLTNYVRLGIGGELLSEADADSGLLVLDGTWRYAASMDRHFESVPVRSLPTWITAYPRVSNFYPDPDGGLATIEAIYAAHVAMGRSTDGLLDEYYWADEFIELNSERIRREG